jgi:hypothetical protein
MSVLTEFALKKGCGDEVGALIDNMRFIFPTGQNVSGDD